VQPPLRHGESIEYDWNESCSFPDSVGHTHEQRIFRAPLLRSAATLATCLLVSTLPARAVAAADVCEVTFRLPAALELTDIQFDVGYTRAAQAFPVDADDGCVALIPNAALAYNDDAESKILTLGLIRPQPFAGPTDVAACRFSHTTIPIGADDLVISVTAADSLPAGGGAPVPVDPLPSVIVSDLNCAGPVTTTTSTSTTTTTTTFGSTTTTTRPGLGGTCLLTLGLDDSVELGLLAFDVGYDPALTNFVVVPGGEHCIAAGTGTQVTTSNDSIEGSLRVALAAGSESIVGPAGVAHCYLFYIGSEPQLTDFSASTALALPTTGTALTPPPTVRPTVIQCPADSATTTTLPAVTTTTLPGHHCGQPLSNDNDTDAADALFILRAVFGAEDCDLCVCDVNQSGSLTVVDVQITLHAALELPATLSCPACD